MVKTKSSSKGQVIKTPFESTKLNQVAVCLPKNGKAKSPSEMNEAISKNIRKEWRGSR